MAPPAGIVDPTKVGKYPVVLSDALLGKESDQLFTGIRYNHKPTLSSSSAPAKARLKPAASSSSSSAYDLSFRDGTSDSYAYEGVRTVGDGRFVLIFNPDREVFVLHKVDSMFHMNITRTPAVTNPESLRRKHPHLDTKTSGKLEQSKKPSAPAPKKQPKQPKKQPPQSGTLPLPEPKKPAPAPAKKRADTPPSDADDSSEDDFFTVENPGGNAPSAVRDFSPAFNQGPRRFDDFVNQRVEEEEDDADGEDDEDDDRSVEHFTLPSPMRNMANGSSASAATATQQSQQQTMDVDGVESEEDDDGGFEDVSTSAPAVAKAAPAVEQEDQDMEDAGADDDDDLEEMMAALEEDEEPAQESDVSEEE